MRESIWKRVKSQRSFEGWIRERVNVRSRDSEFARLSEKRRRVVCVE